MATATQTARLLSVQSPAGEDVLLITGFSAVEAMSGLFSLNVALVTEPANAGQVKPDQLIGQPMTVKVALKDDFESGPFRFFNGMVSRFSCGGEDERFNYYEAELVPWTWLLTQTADCRIFQDKSALEIIKTIFDDLKGDFSFVDYKDQTEGSFTKMDYCAQYRETDFNFVSRLMEQDGIYYYFEHSEDGHTLVLANSPQANADCPHQHELRYEPSGGTDAPENDTIVSWTGSQQLRTGKYTLRDYHFQMPDKTLEVSRPTDKKIGGNDKLEVYDFLGEYAQRFNKPGERLGDVEKEGTGLVKLRMEEEETPHREHKASSNCRTVLPGYKFTLTDHSDDAQNGEYLITAVQHTAVQSPAYYSVSGENPFPYQNSISCIPHSVPFRPPRLTPKPVVEGLQSAVVVGKSGEEIHTDKYGRVRIQFHWDREGKKDEKSTCWVRVAQSIAGKQWGAHFWPRIGHEVLVAFMEGDPDQPIVVGSVYNAANMPPYAMPDNQTRSGYKSRSSKDGNTNTFNELRFEDKKDEEEIYIHAEKDLNCVVENNETRKVGFDDKEDGDQTIEIFNNQGITIGDTQAKDGSQTVEIKKDRTTTLKEGNDTLQIKMGNRDSKIDMGNDALTIKMGNQTTKLDLGKSDTEAMQSIELKVGQSSIKVDQMGVTIKGMMVKIEGQMMSEMKGMMTTVKGDAMLTAKGGITMIN